MADLDTIAAELIAAAEKATEGEWLKCHDDEVWVGVEYVAQCSEPDDLNYIIAAQPERLIPLLREFQRLRALEQGSVAFIMEAGRRAALEEARQMASNLLRDMMVAPTRDYVAAYEMVHRLHDDLRALAEKQP